MAYSAVKYPAFITIPDKDKNDAKTAKEITVDLDLNGFGLTITVSIGFCTAVIVESGIYHSYFKF